MALTAPTPGNGKVRQNSELGSSELCRKRRVCKSIEPTLLSKDVFMCCY